MRNYLGLFFLLVAISGIAQQDYSALEQQADSLANEEQYIAANNLLEQIIQRASDDKEFAKLIRLSIKSAVNYQQEKVYDKAELILQETIKNYKEDFENDSLLALAYHKLGVSYFYLDLQHQAITNYDKALRLRKNFLPPLHIDIIKGHRNIGAALFELQNYSDARVYLEKAIDVHLPNVQDSFLLADSYRDYARILFHLEDYKAAELHLDVAKVLFDTLYRETPWEMERLYEDFFDLHKFKNEPKKMIYYAKKSLDLVQSFEEKYDSDHIWMANCYNNLGISYELVDSLQLAINYYQKAIILNRQFNGSLADNYTNLSIAYKKKGGFDLALTAINQAYNINVAANLPEELVGDLNNKGEILALSGRLKEGLTVQQQAIALLVQDSSLKNPYKKLELKHLTTGNPSKLAALLNDKATVLLQLAEQSEKEKNLLAAIHTYQTVSDLINQIRQGYHSDISKSFLAKKAKSFFANAIKANFSIYQLTKKEAYIEDIYQLMEQSKAIILLDALADANAKENANIPAGLLTKEKELALQIAEVEQQINKQAKQDTQLKSKLLTLNQQLGKLRKDLEQIYPEYYQLKYNTTITSIDTIQKRLAAQDAALIEYFLTNTSIYALVIDKSEVSVFNIPIVQPLKALISELQRGVLTYHLSKSRSNQLSKIYADTLVIAANKAYKQLIDPITAQIDLPEKLIIIPDEILGYVPFELLISELPEDNTLFHSYQYLLKKHQFSYSYSATLLSEMSQQKQQVTSNNFLAFAPSFNETAASKDGRGISENRGALGVLEYNVPEVKALKKLMGGKIYINEAATEANFLKEAPNYKILHLSTHGKANDKVGDYAYLAFSEIKDGIENEFLYNRDLYNLQLNADMVVLSACETGIGELQKGEGIISLARGFSYAGAKSIITTLWSVNDSKTKTLMEHFYGYIKAGETKDAALRQAKLDFIAEHPEDAHPFYWAAFVPIGDMSAIELDRTPWGLWIAFFSILGLILFLFWRSRKN